MRIKIMPDYGCSPLWVINSYDFFEPIEIKDFNNLSDPLIDRLEIWREKFDNTLNQEYPNESGFEGNLELENFEKEGVEIWKEMLIQFPKDNISFFSIKVNKLFETLSDYEFEVGNG